jgi:antitoxin (DNA-binding transcriptional repressor) of toxin-antitoxin stability system
VRRAAIEPITVTDRGAAVAIIQPAPAPARVTFAQRRLRPEFLKLQSEPMLGVDSGPIISEDRSAR